jgi:hypothetical protein
MTQVTDHIAITNASRRGETAATKQPTIPTWSQLVTPTGVTTDAATDMTTVRTIEETITAVDLELAAAINNCVLLE